MADYFPVTNTAEQAALENARYNLNNASYSPDAAAAVAKLQETTSGAQIVAVATQQNAIQDAANEAAKHQEAFSQPRNDIPTTHSDLFNSLTAQYAEQHGGGHDQSFYENPTSNAAEIAAQVGASVGAVNSAVASQAISEGYSGPIYAPATYSNSNVIVAATTPVSTIDMSKFVGENTVAAIDKSSGMAGIPSFATTGETTTVFVPANYTTQEQLNNVKLGIDYNTGELSIYQQPTGHSLMNLVGGAGRNALQSGMFTVDKAETPYVVQQGDIGTAVLNDSKNLSRLGSEAYGGYVTTLDNRVLGDTQLSTYSNVNNLANYVNPQGPNMGKVEAPGADIPNTVSANAPAIQYMDANGFISGSGKAFTSILGKSTTVTPTEETTISNQISPGVYTTGSLQVLGKQSEGPSSLLPVVEGSYSASSVTTPSNPSIANFASNLFGNIGNFVTLGLANLSTTAGFESTKTTENYQVSLPTPYVAEAPKQYSPSYVVMDMTSVIDTKEQNAWDSASTRLSEYTPKVPEGLALAANAGALDAASTFMVKGYNALSENPLLPVKSGIEAGAFILGGEVVGSAATALSAGTIAESAVSLAGKATPYIFGAGMGTSVIKDVTLGFTDLSKASAGRLGEFTFTQGIPMLIGGGLVSKYYNYESPVVTEKATTPISEFNYQTESQVMKISEKELSHLDSTSLIPVEPKYSLETGKMYVVSSTKVISPEYGDIQLSLEKSIINIDTLGKASRVSTAEDIFINPNQLSAMTETPIIGGAGVFGSTKVTEVRQIQDIYGSGQTYTFDLGRSATVMEPGAFDFSNPIASAEKIFESPARAVTTPKLNLLPEELVGSTTDYARVYSPENGFVVTRIERLPETERLKFETGSSIEGPDINLGNVPEYLRSGAIREASSRNLIDVGIETRTAISSEGPITGTRYVAPSEAVTSGMFGSEAQILPRVEAELRSRTIPRDTLEIRAMKEQVRKEDLYRYKLPGADVVKSEDAILKPSSVNKQFKNSPVSGKSGRNAELVSTEDLTQEKMRSINTALDQLRRESERTKESKTKSKASTLYEDEIISRRTVSFPEYSPKRSTATYLDEEEIVYPVTLPSGMTRPTSQSMEQTSSKSALQLTTQTESNLSTIQQEVSRTQDRISIPVVSVTPYVGDTQKTDVYRYNENVVTPTIDQTQNPLVTTTPTQNQIVNPIVTPVTTPYPINTTSPPDITPTKINTGTPSIPTPPVIPSWSPGSGLPAYGVKNRRKKIQVETSYFGPKMLEKESKKFFGAVGNGKIASSTPSGEITITNYRKKSKSIWS